VDELDVDVAYALEPQVAVAALYAFSPAASPEHYRFAVALRPFSMNEVVAAHYAITDAADRSVSGRVLYFDVLRAPPFVETSGRRVRVESSMRADARVRARERAASKPLRDAEELIARTARDRRWALGSA
jgi:hypothetical protein